MRFATILIAFLVLAVAVGAQDTALQDVRFSWENGKRTLTGFSHATPPEIERFDKLKITVDPKFIVDSARQLGGGTLPTPLEQEFGAFTELADALRGYTDAIAAAVARSPSADISLDAGVKKARDALKPALRTFHDVVRMVDRPLYDSVDKAVGAGQGYVLVTQALQHGIEVLTARLQEEPAGGGAIGMTATIVPLESGARPLHLPGYDNNAESSIAAVPAYIPLIDDRTRAEVQAAQTLADTAKQLGQVSQEVEASIGQLKTALENLRTQLKTNVLEAQLGELEQDITMAAQTNLGDLLKAVQAARTLVHTLNSANLELTGATDADRLLNLATSLINTANALSEVAAGLPKALQQLSTETDAALKKHLVAVKDTTVSAIKSAITGFEDKQTFFVTLAGNLEKVADQFSANDDAALSATRLEAAAKAITQPADLSTSLDLGRIASDVHVGDHVIIEAAVFRRNADKTLNTNKQVESGQQSFVIQRYGIFPDAVRGGLLFADPRSKIDRKISYQPVPALGFYWRLGLRNHPVWNAASPSFGFTMALLDFSDTQAVEVGLAAGVSLLRDLVWTGYGRNLQAKANYFYVGVNPLLLAKMIANPSRLYQ